MLDTAVNWADAQRRVLKSYREWIRAVRCLPLRGYLVMRSVLLACFVPGELQWAMANGVVMQAPEIQTMYSLNMPVSALRTKMREEFERHRYVNKVAMVDVLLFKSHAEFQVR